MIHKGDTILSRLLAQLGVPYTPGYADAQFRSMTFKSLFGLSHLLKNYEVDNTAVRIADKSEITKLSAPLLAQGRNGVFSIVTEIDPAADRIVYDERGIIRTATVDGFTDLWNGIALLVYPTDGAREPDYTPHLVHEVVQSASKYILMAAFAAVFVYFFVTRHVYAHVSNVLLTVFDCVGLYFSYLLLQKSLNIHTRAGDRVCGVLERGGCDHIVSLGVSKLFGVFSWSEVGFGYFGVSLATLLAFPHLWPALAVCNACCLPYTFWSIWYQRFRARRWCTLCVGVQSTLWLLFFCYLGGGWFRGALPLRLDFFVLLAVYITAVLLLNLIVRVFKNLPCHAENQENS